MLKNIKLLIVLLCTFNCLVAQEKALKIFNEQTGKEILIKENKRVKIKHSNGVKNSGKFKVFDSETIIIKHKKIKLNQIEKIKRNPLVLSILTNGLLYYCGFVLAGASVVIYVFSGSTASFLLTIPAAAFIYAGVKSPNILKGYKSPGYWKYEIITKK